MLLGHLIIGAFWIFGISVIAVLKALGMAWTHHKPAKTWRVTDNTRRLIYNLLRSPPGLWEALKTCYNESKPQDAALTMDNINGDYFVVGNEFAESPENWKEIQARFKSKKQN